MLLQRKSIPIEPLTDARWCRIEQSLLDELARSEAESRHARVPLAAPEERRRRVRGAAVFMLVGSAAALIGAAGWRVLDGVGLRSEPTRVETRTSGSHLELGGSSVDVGPQSSIRVTGDDARGIVVVLDRGSVECDVAPRRGRSPFVVEAGAVTVRVVGTHFVVVRADEAVTVDVQRGTVEVTEAAVTTSVRAGAHWTDARASGQQNVAPAVSAPPPVDDGLVHDARAPEGRAVTSAGDAAGRGAGGPTLPSSASTPRASAPQGSPSALATPPPQSSAHGAPSAREQYETASSLEATRPERAIAIYQELSRQGGPWGMNALFAEGRLEAERGHRDEARRLLSDYLSRHPQGPNAADAQQLLARLR